MSDDEIEELKHKVQQLERHQADLEIALQIAIEHGDAMEDELFTTNLRLKKELNRRKQIQAHFKKIAQDRKREKEDLQIILDTIVEHGDEVDAHWRKEMSLVKLLSETDGLTLIPNRRKFDTYLEEQWQLLSSRGNYLSLILCDVDYFKMFNDSYGHLAGDGCLKRVAYALSSALRNDNDLVARYGGEEFVVVLPDTDLSDAILVADRIHAVIAQLSIPHSKSAVSSFVTLSMGIATINPAPHIVSLELIEATDRLLYQAKLGGRNRYVTEVLNSSIEPEMSLLG